VFRISYIMKIATAHRRPWQLIILSIFLPVAGVSPVDLNFCRVSFAASSSVKTGAVQQAPRNTALIGRWQRPDGGYVLEIKKVSENGNVDAAYFNPNPIHVASAEAADANGELNVVVELRDVNYPGSTYNLTYDPADDRLKGTYYQAVAGETYRIFFIRVQP